MVDGGEMPKIGRKVLRLRQAYKMSLDDLAAKSGVSKSVLSQIERDQNNPTLSTIYRICKALHITVEEIVREDTDPRIFDKLTEHSTPVIRSDDGRCNLRILGPITTVNWLQWYDIEVDPGGRLVSDPHDPGTLENLTVLEGELEVATGESSERISKGETLRYPADERHVVSNPGSTPARATMVVVLGRPIT
ncbi:helix-turn-helix domain-containing protein [Aestuariispira insulae]|uniref:XRE family transcriptional regulator n=1 Tax=Aestuariispira insulae TaxID=1461337 RepID=A0A3D9HX61_9PROT|nr:XRE family transcriptional regulator [Aestuariispira insulae]RED54093.1 XRE family transcriptional regulator [Aestuariispira insulae]